MTEERYVLPEEMLKAVSDAWYKPGSGVREAVEAAIRWLAEHPIPLTKEDALLLRDLALEVNRSYGTQELTEAACVAVAFRWQRIMLRESTPPVLREIKSAIMGTTLSPEQAEEIIQLVKLCVPSATTKDSFKA